MATAAPPIDNKEAESKALVARVREGSLAMQFGGNGLQLRNLEDALAFGKTMIESGFAPKGVTKPASVVWIVQRGAELGVNPISALDSFYVGPSGKPELYAKAALGVCVAKGILEPEYDLDTEGTGDTLTAIFTFKRKGWSKAKTRRFAFLEAKTAGLVRPNSNWQLWPTRMVQARVVGFALKDYFNDVLMGCAIEGDHEPLKAEVTEISRESLAPTSVAPDPLFAQLENKTEPEAGTTGDGVWDFLNAPQAAPDDHEPEPNNKTQAGGQNAPAELPETAAPLGVRKPRASKKDQEFFYGLCRSRGMTDPTIQMFLGTHGFERIDEVPEDEMPKLIAAVKEIKAAKK